MKGTIVSDVWMWLCPLHNSSKTLEILKEKNNYDDERLKIAYLFNKDCGFQICPAGKHTDCS